MQTERVTFLTTPENKAALDAFASGRNKSVGHVLREASAQYMAQPVERDEDEAALEMMLPELEAAVASIRVKFDDMSAAIAQACAAVDAALAGDPA